VAAIPSARVALPPVELVDAQTLGDAWLEVARRIVDRGASVYEPELELMGALV